MSTIRFERDARYSSDPAEIALWAAAALAVGLYRDDGIARFTLARPELIAGMACVPGVAWIFYGGELFDAGGEPRRMRWQAFTRPDMRRRGIGSRLYAYARGHRDALDESEAGPDGKW